MNMNTNAVDNDISADALAVSLHWLASLYCQKLSDIWRTKRNTLIPDKPKPKTPNKSKEKIT